MEERTPAKGVQGEKPYRRLVEGLLICGIASSAVYLFTDVLASSLWHGYIWVDQAVSELNAIGSPVRPLTLALFVVYNLLVVGFAAGVWLAAEGRWPVRVASIMLFVYAVVGEVTNIFSPMNVRGTATAPNDVGHIILTTVEVLSIVLFIAFGSGVAGSWFRVYSIATIAVLIGAGVITGMLATYMTAAASSTPWAGLIERVNIYGTMLWVAVFSGVLLRGWTRHAATGATTPPESVPIAPAGV